MFEGKVIAVTGASGALGKALMQELARQGATLIALTSSNRGDYANAQDVVKWQTGQEETLGDRFKSIDILVLNHGVNVYGDRTPAAIQKSLEVNALSQWKLAELFFSTVAHSPNPKAKELWVNTSEAEVSPALSPLYEISKRLIGTIITLRTLDAPCTVRKLILGPFKSELNPYGVMTPRFVAGAIAFLASKDIRTIIVTVNPCTYLLVPIKELSQKLYYRMFSKADG
ncbi:MAG: NAD-dependent epimerase/dehydratase family protein [Cyanobacteria bacterium P01_F01_bin.150]